MKIIAKYRTQFIRTGIVSTPLISAFMLLPIILFIKSMSDANISIFRESPGRLPIAIFFTSFYILAIWAMNLALLRRYYGKGFIKGFDANSYRYFISFLFLFVTGIPLIFLAEEWRPIDIRSFSWYPLVAITTINSFILLLIDLIISQGEKAELRIEKAELEVTQLITQQEQLKQQIHPHFLFNSLGTLRILIKKDAKSADIYTGRLAKFLRSSISLAQSDIIPIQEELDFLENYFNLQKMRFAEGIQLAIDIPDAIIKQGRVPVFSLQILAENAIKHNAFSVSEPMRLQVKYCAPDFLEISNNKAEKFTSETSTGIGLQNLKMRFQHFTNFVPEITETKEEFNIKIKILAI